MATVVGINQGAVMQARMEPFLDACGRAGVTEVELRVPKLIEALYHLSPAQLREYLDCNAVRVTAVNSLDDFALVPDENLGLLEREAQSIAELCHAVDCDLVVAPVGRWFAGDVPQWAWVRDRSAKRLKLIGRVLDQEGIRVGVEPIAFPFFTVWSLEQSMEIIEQADLQSAVLVADVYNLMQGESTAESMRRLAPKLGIIHVNDAPHREYEKLDVMYTRSFPGEGVLSPAEWVRAARDGGYSGPVSMEVFMKPVWDMELEQAVSLCAARAAAFGETL